MSRADTIWRISIGAVATLILGTAISYATLYRLGVRPRLGFAPGWSMVDVGENAVTSEDLRGAIVVYTFTCANCTDRRRQTLPILAEVQAQVSSSDTSDVPVRFVAVSFDPERDLPSGLAHMATSVGVGDGDTDWHFLTGPPRSIDVAVRRGFGVYYERNETGEFLFDPVVVIVDGWGIVRAHYRVGLPDVDEVVRDIRSLIKEVEAQTGAGRYAYDAAHLFSCYSRV